MEKLASKGLGEVITLDRTIAFVKFPHSIAPEGKLAEFGLSENTFSAVFQDRDLNLPSSKKQELISKSAQCENILQALS